MPKAEYEYSEVVEIEIDEEYVLVYNQTKDQWFYRYVSLENGEEATIHPFDEEGNFTPVHPKVNQDKFEEIQGHVRKHLKKN